MTNYLRLLLSALLLVSVTALQATEITVDNPWIRAAPPNAPALAAFMRLTNNTDKEIKLESVSGKGYERIELHRTVDVDGMMKMMKQSFIPIPAKGSTVLKPGSWHIMLIKPESVPEMETNVALTLYFSNGVDIEINAKVKVGKMAHKHVMPASE